jgi:prepilin-type N-terminal cleavage/methylation domain-containing protein
MVDTNRAGFAARRGFTLVELLVVIVIIGVLAGLLIPAAAKVIDEGHATACRSNLQQLHKLGLAWSASRKGRWPSGQGGALWISFVTMDPPLIDKDRLELLHCPFTDTEPSAEQTDYLGPAGSFSKLRDSAPLAADKEDNHAPRRSGGNVLRKDGSVQDHPASDPVWEAVRATLVP